MGTNRASPDQYQLRFPPGLRESVKAAAERNGRSMNAEIILAIEVSLLGDAHDEHRLARIEAKIDAVLAK